MELPLVFAPNPIFKKKTIFVAEVSDHIKECSYAMLETMYAEQGVGMGANMVGILEPIVVIDLQEGGVKQPIVMINPQITWTSDQTDTHVEASLSFPGIDALITRPVSVHASYLDLKGVSQMLEADGYLARVIQHEVDYLNGVVFLDYLTPMKRNMLTKKMIKFKKQWERHHHHAGHKPGSGCC